MWQTSTCRMSTITSASLDSFEESNEAQVRGLRNDMRMAYMANDWHRLRKKAIKLARLKPGLNIEERFFLATSQESINRSLLDSLRELGQSQASGLVEKRLARRAVMKSYKDELKARLCHSCQELLDLLLTCLIPHSVDQEAKVDYQRMKGAQHLVLCEVSSKKDELEWARLAYASAWTNAKHLPACNVCRLSAANALSQFLVSQLNKPGLAVKIGQEAVDAADCSLEALLDMDTDPMYPVSAHLMGVIRYNLKTWSSPRKSSVVAVRSFVSRLYGRKKRPASLRL